MPPCSWGSAPTTAESKDSGTRRVPRFQIVAKHNLLGAAAGVIVFLVLVQFIPATACADGWESPSIGRRGACSHHGGVRSNGIWYFGVEALSLFVGAVVATKIAPSVPDRTASDNAIALLGSESASYRPAADLIARAIEARRRIAFVYTKRGSTHSEARTILPRKFERMARPSTRSITLCVVGSCDKRRAERTFAVELMRDVRMVETSSSPE